MTEAGIFDSFTKVRHSETRPTPHGHLRLIARGVNETLEYNLYLDQKQKA